MSLESSLARPVSEAMTAHVATLSSSLTLPEAARTLANNRVSGMPVVDDSGVVVGVVTLSDFVVALGRDAAPDQAKRSSDGEEDGLFYDSVQLVALMGELLRAGSHNAHVTVADIMSTRLVTMRESDPIRAAAQIMSKRRVHRVLVTDEAGKLSGIVSALDIVELLS